MPTPSPSSAAAAAPRGALVALVLATLLASLGTSIANVALPALARAFDAPFADVQRVVVAYLLGLTGSIVGVGRLGDLYDRRRLLAAGLALFVVAAGGAALAPSLGPLLLARLLQGVAAAALMALPLAFVADLAPAGHTGRVMGLMGTTSAIGTALGPAVGGLLTAASGWRAVFLVQVPVGLLVLVLVLRLVPAPRPAARPAGGRGAATPFLPPGLLREPELVAGLVMSLLVSGVLMATLVVGPFYLSGALGLAAGRVGLAMAAGPLVAALTGLPAGRLVDQLGSARTTRAGLLGVASGAALLALLPRAAGLPGYVVSVGVLTAGYALFQAANNTGVLRDRGPARGVVSGLLTLSRNLGLVGGAALMGALFAAGAGRDDLALAPADALAAGMRLTFAVGAGLVGLAFLVGTGGGALAVRPAR